MACDSGHDVINEKKPALIILSDQNFPPHMAPGEKEKNCAAIIRVEDATLSELVSVFCDVFRNYVGSGVGGAGLPTGSVVLLSSLSDLERNGLEKHADDLVRNLSVIAAKAGGGVSAVPGISVPLYGVVGGPVIRDWANLDAWLANMKVAGGFAAPDTRHANWDLMADGGSENTIPDRSIVVALPLSLRNPRKVPADLADFDSALPVTISAITPETEAEMLANLYRELNGRFFLRLENSPKIDRGDTAAEGQASQKIYIIGASHARNLRAPLEASGHNVVLLPHWAPSMEAAGKIEKAMMADPPRQRRHRVHGHHVQLLWHRYTLAGNTTCWGPSRRHQEELSERWRTRRPAW